MPRQAPYPDDHPGVRHANGEPLLSFGVHGRGHAAAGGQVISNLVDFDLGLHEAATARAGTTRSATSPQASSSANWAATLETGVRGPRNGARQSRLEAGPQPRRYGGYESIQRHPGRYAAATEMLEGWDRRWRLMQIPHP